MQPTNFAVLKALLILRHAEYLLQERLLLQVVRQISVREEARQCIPCGLLQLGDVNVQLLEVGVLDAVGSRDESQNVVEKPQAFC